MSKLEVSLPTSLWLIWQRGIGRFKCYIITDGSVIFALAARKAEIKSNIDWYTLQRLGFILNISRPLAELTCSNLM